MFIKIHSNHICCLYSILMLFFPICHIIMKFLQSEKLFNYLIHIEWFFSIMTVEHKFGCIECVLWITRNNKIRRNSKNKLLKTKSWHSHKMLLWNLQFYFRISTNPAITAIIPMNIMVFLTPWVASTWLMISFLFYWI